MDAEDEGFLETRMVRIAATNNNYLDFAGLRKPPRKFSSCHSLCARLFSVRLNVHFLIPDRYKQAINTTKGAVFSRHCRCSSSVTVMGRTETSIDLLLLFAPISQSSSCIGGRGWPFHDVGSNHDDWDHRTQTAGAVARRRDDAHHRCHRCHDLPDPAGTCVHVGTRLLAISW